MKRLRPGTTFVGLALLLLLAIAFSAARGSAPIPLSDTLGILVDRLPGVNLKSTWNPRYEDILLDIRIPRILAGALVGASLASAGVVLQGLLRNPLADPYVTGTSAGAAFGATLAILLPLGTSILGIGAMSGAAFVGALAAVLLVYYMSRVGNRTPVVSMLLAGFAVSAVLIALVTLLITLNDRLQLNIRTTFSFIMGGFSSYEPLHLLISASLVLPGIALAWSFSRSLNALAVGEEGAAYLGINVERVKFLALSLAALLTAVAVSLSGLVAFVGLVVPHAMRLLIGPDHRHLLPASALAGAFFMVTADLMARTLLSPTEVPAGVFTALIGGPYFIYLLRRTGREYAL